MNVDGVGYKVLSTSRYSITMSQDLGGILYPVGEIAKPLQFNGPLAVFNKRGHAINFLSNVRFNRYVIGIVVECEYDLSSKKILWVKGKTDGLIRTLHGYQLPSGTVLCDAVRCLE